MISVNLRQRTCKIQKLYHLVLSQYWTHKTTQDLSGTKDNQLPLKMPRGPNGAIIHIERLHLDCSGAFLHTF